MFWAHAASPSLSSAKFHALRICKWRLLLIKLSEFNDDGSKFWFVRFCTNSWPTCYERRDNCVLSRHLFSLSSALPRVWNLLCALSLKLRKDRKPHVEKVPSATMRWNFQESRLIFCKTAKERCGGVISFCALENVERRAQGAGGCEILRGCFRLVEFHLSLFCVLFRGYCVAFESFWVLTLVKLKRVILVNFNAFILLSIKQYFSK